MRKCEFSLELEHYFRLESIGNRATTAADGVIDLSNVRLVSLFVSGNQGGTVVFGNIQVSAEMPAGYLSTPLTVVTPALTETGRCASEE